LIRNYTVDFVSLTKIEVAIKADYTSRKSSYKERIAHLPAGLTQPVHSLMRQRIACSMTNTLDSGKTMAQLRITH